MRINALNNYNLFIPSFTQKKYSPDKQWENIADSWIGVKQNNNNDILNKSITYPELTKLIGNDLKGLKILDLGCGEGYSSRILANAGASVTAIDFSQKLINHARQRAYYDNQDINYIHGSMTDLSMLKDKSQDKVVSVMSLMYLSNEEIGKTLKEVKRVLKDDGELIIITKHPFTTRNNLADRTKEPHTMNYKESYFNKKVFNYKLKLNNISEFLPIYPQTVSSLYNLIRKSGFEVTKLSEPAPSKNVMSKYNDNPHLEFYNNNPMILGIKAKKA